MADRSLSCSVKNCGNPVRCKKLCNQHYKTQWRDAKRRGLPFERGDPLADHRPISRVDQSCSVEGCDKLVLAKSWCREHYEANRLYGDPLAAPRKGKRLPEGSVCYLDGTEAYCRLDDGRFVCERHYTVARRNDGDPEAPLKRVRDRGCKIPGCSHKHKGYGYCKVHLNKLTKYGDAEADRPIRETLSWVNEVALPFDSDECLYWPFAIGGSGYGAMFYAGRMHTASHVVCLLAHGESPRGRKYTLHSCNNRECVNPKHLSWDTQRNNIIQAVMDGRIKTVVTPDIIKQMFEMDGKKIPRRQIAIHFGVSQTQTHRILKGESWRHLNNK